MIVVKGGVKQVSNETERLTLRLPPELKAVLDEKRKRMGISLNALVVQLLWQHVQQAGQAEPPKA